MWSDANFTLTQGNHEPARLAAFDIEIRIAGLPTSMQPNTTALQACRGHREPIALAEAFENS